MTSSTSSRPMDGNWELVVSDIGGRVPGTGGNQWELVLFFGATKKEIHSAKAPDLRSVRQTAPRWRGRRVLGTALPSSHVAARQDPPRPPSRHRVRRRVPLTGDTA